ncbi:hypothetical protein B0H66DRAFT_97969 [Apodospora peruviana]|uniref:Uncharacterized protein n=1 Tax=Apodospora peruviana TaxID=516989 RepID=A0AAE0IUD9_9PEZI|nr:hypothetical protein B0H66DRAFT_97969 [Apodospora peruviana]
MAEKPDSSSSLSTEGIVALALGVPTFFIALLSLWIAYLTFATTRQPHLDPLLTRRLKVARSWPVPLRSSWESNDTYYSLPGKPSIARSRLSATSMTEILDMGYTY